MKKVLGQILSLHHLVAVLAFLVALCYFFMLYAIFLLRALAFARKKSFTPENARTIEPEQGACKNKETEEVRPCDFITDWHTTDTETVPLNKQKE